MKKITKMVVMKEFGGYGLKMNTNESIPMIH